MGSQAFANGTPILKSGRVISYADLRPKMAGAFGARLYEHDVFVSYAHVDNLPISEHQWLVTLVPILRQVVSEGLGRTADIWLDRRIAGNAQLWPELVDRLRNCAIFLAVVSRGQLRSDWCKRELAAFVEHNRTDKDLGKRIVRVCKHHVDENIVPAELRAAPAFYFYERASEAGLTEFFPSETVFLQRAREVAAHVATLLVSMGQHGGEG
jgi:hypothetical protein